MSKDVAELLSRGVGEFIDPDGAFKKKLETNPQNVVIKFGIDPTRPDIHLGHAFIFRKLRKFQDLGAKIVFLVGDFTALIGDPTGKSITRPEISFSEVKSNAKTYLQQVSSILDVSDKSKYEVLWNSIWYQAVTDYPGQDIGQKIVAYKKDREEFVKEGKLPTTSFWNFLSILRTITHSQLIERDMFQERLKKGNQLYMHEMMYPVLQGIDSNMISDYFNSCDLEVGGTDQTFNMLIGRTTMKVVGKDPQAVLSFKLLEGIDGKEKMSKSLGNYIAITDEPNDMYGKTMSIPDSSIKNYFELCTNLSQEEINFLSNSHPKEAKMRLAFEITKIYHGEAAAQKAQENFETAFSKGGVPEDIMTVRAGEKESLADILLREGLVASKTEYSRLEKAGAVKEIESGVYRVGKHRFVRIERAR